MENSQIPNNLDSKIREEISRGHTFIISIDGMGGAGKTTLAKSIASNYSGEVFSFDDYLEEHKGTYLPNLKYDDLLNDLKTALGQPKLIVLEGLCALSVLQQINCTPNYSIYIKSVDKFGEWTDEYYCSEENNLKEIFCRLDRLEAANPDTPGIADSDRESARYHIEMKPITNANLVIEQFINNLPEESSSI